jgi:hypothetical protein
MTNLITLDRAKAQVKKLQDYIALVETYEADTLEKQIVKEYAITNSIAIVSKNLGVDREEVVYVLQRRGKDELHKIVRSGYMYKTRASRR